MNIKPASVHSIVFHLLKYNPNLKAGEIFEKLKAAYAMGDKDKLRNRIHTYVSEYKRLHK